VRVIAAAACAIVIALAGCGSSSSYTLMQMNLCLSGIGGCYGRTAYPAVLDEAAARIRASHPNAVTVNEACRNDVAQIARRTGYHLSFSRVVYLGKPFPCVRPGGRGLFGDAVLTRAPVETIDEQDFKAQAGVERRRWLCVITRGDIDVCTSHLDTHTPTEAAGNEPQCRELAALLARRAGARAVVFGGDVNRRSSCAPDGFWTRTDRSGDQEPGDQQVYGSRTFRSPSAQVFPATHTDHGFLLVGAHL
jgi:endonuclease/exonuclease/phosphatase family metal-dependent hydrolase